MSGVAVRCSLFHPRGARLIERGGEVKILFVCMGNICRSPAAEGIFRSLVEDAGLEEVIEIDSAGTHGYHVGEAPDSRMQRAAALRGYDLSSLRARKVAAADMAYFDLILAMDRTNLDALHHLCPREYQDRLKLFMQYAQHVADQEVPDPYYGLGHGFSQVLDMLEDAAQGLLAVVMQSEGGTTEWNSHRPFDSPGR